MQTFNGMTVHLSLHALEYIEVEVARTWRDRLLTRLRCTCGTIRWEPWRKTKLIKTPRPGCFQIGDGLIMHPEIWAKLKMLGVVTIPQ